MGQLSPVDSGGRAASMTVKVGGVSMVSTVTRGQGVNHIDSCGLEAASKAVKQR